MSEIRINKPYPIPSEPEYQAAAELTDEHFTQHGGAWSYFHKSALIDVESNGTLRTLMLAMSTHAKLIEPIKDDNFHPYDPLFRATHAFRAGQWTAGFMVHFLHNDKFSYEAMHDSINKGLPYSTYHTQKEYAENGRFLEALGEEGLKTAGEGAREYLEKWQKDIVSEPSVRRYYSLGAGAIICASHQMYSQVFTELNVRYEAAQLNDELSAYLSNFPDSSDK